MKYHKTLSSLYRPGNATPITIADRFKREHGIDVIVEDTGSRDLGRYIVYINEKKCVIPKRKIAYLDKINGEATIPQEMLIDVAVPIPLFLGLGVLSEGVKTINSSSDRWKQSSKWLQEIFSCELAAGYFNSFFSKSVYLGSYKKIIFEAIESYYMGLDHTATMALLPVFEAGLRNIQNDLAGGSSDEIKSNKLLKNLRKIIINHGRKMHGNLYWHPGIGTGSDLELGFFKHNNNQCNVICSFMNFVQNVLYMDSKSAAHQHGYNRHLIVHLLKNDFDDGANFVRTFLALTHITFIESLSQHEISFMWPGISEEDQRLAAYFRELLDTFYIKRKSVINSLGV